MNIYLSFTCIILCLLRQYQLMSPAMTQTQSTASSKRTSICSSTPQLSVIPYLKAPQLCISTSNQAMAHLDYFHLQSSHHTFVLSLGFKIQC